MAVEVQMGKSRNGSSVQYPSTRIPESSRDLETDFSRFGTPAKDWFQELQAESES